MTKKTKAETKNELSDRDEQIKQKQAVFAADVSGKLRFYDLSFAELFFLFSGVQAKVGLQLLGIKTENPVVLDIQDYIKNTKSVKQAFQKEIKWNGFEYFLELSFSAPDKDKVILGSIRDITQASEVEQELKASKRELVSLMNNLPGIAFRCRYDSNWTMLFLSDTFEEFTGYSKDEVLLNNSIAFNDLIHEDDQQSVSKLVTEAVEKDKRYQVEYRIITSKGEIRWMYEQGKAFVSDNGDIQFIEGIILNISSRKYAEKVRTAVGEIAGLSMEKIEFDNDVFFENVRRKIRGFMNAEYFSVLHFDEANNQLKVLYSSDKNLMKDLSEVKDARKTLAYKVIREGRPILLESHDVYEMIDKGEVHFYGKEGRQWMGIPMKLMDNKMGCVVLQNYETPIAFSDQDLNSMNMISQQISLALNRKHAVKELKKREQYYRNLYMNLPESYHSLDENGRIMAVNNKWLEVMGYERNRVMGQHFSSFWTDSHKDRYEDFWDTLKKPGAIDQKLVRLVKRNGKSISVILTAQAEADQLGVFRRAHCVFADITAIKEAEEAMRVAKEKAEENDQLKSAFLANMSHEIRSPMNAILGFSDLLKDPKLDEARKRKFIRMIHERGEDLLRIIDDIIDISKLEAGSLKFNYEMVNLNDFLENLQMSFMQERRRQKKEDIYFVMERAPELKPVSWKTDKVRTRQILMNFYSNALKFTDRGYVKLIVKRSGEDEICFSVEDTGIGIARDQQELVFERFRQVDLEYKSSRSGTGLGLSISRNLAHEMDGRVELSSTIDKGSTFSLILPLTDIIIGREKSKKIPRKATSNSQYSNKNILVVEDDFNNYLYLKNAIEKLNASVVWARNGVEAMKTVQGVFRPDLILMDIRLPGINGLELTETIKENYPDIPIIAQTAFAQQEDREQAMKSGCDDYIAKPIPMELLNAIISKHLK